MNLIVIALCCALVGAQTLRFGAGEPCLDGVEGICYDTKLQNCPTELVTGKCGGDNFVKCCLAPKEQPADPQNPQNPQNPDDQGSSGQVAAIFGPRTCYAFKQVGLCTNDCTGTNTLYSSEDSEGCSGNQKCCAPKHVTCTAYGNPGVCTYTSYCPSNKQSFVSGASVSGCNKFPNSVTCCSKKHSGAQQVANPATTSGSGSCAGLVFPLASGSLREISVNWGFARGGGKRCHAGLDIYTRSARKVVSVGDGVVKAVLRNWYKCSGGSIDAILVYHSSGPLAGKTINYGEVNPGTYSVRVNSRVTTGQSLGTARNCGMLHFELYNKQVVRNSHWYPKSGRVGKGCHRTSLSSKPRELMDPRPLLACLKPRGARFRHGISFLNEAADEPDSETLALFDSDAAEELGLEEAGGENNNSGSVVAIAVVVAVLALVLMIGVVVLLLVKRRAKAGQVQEFTETPTATTDTSEINLEQDAQYQCSHCGKGFDYAEDLTIHVEKRH